MDGWLSNHLGVARVLEALGQSQHRRIERRNGQVERKEDVVMEGAGKIRGETETTAALSKDAIFEILRNSRRRSVLRWLAEWDGQGTTGKLAEHIAAEENDTTIRELSSKQRKTVYITLYQGHLPKLSDFGVVTYDQSRGTVELTEAADVLFPYLELAREQSANRPPDRRRSIAAAIPSWLMPWR